MFKKPILLKLINYLPSEIALGSDLGRDLLTKLRCVLSEHPQESIFQISLSGVKAIDATCFRESIVALGLIEKSKKGLFITDIENEDIIFNLECATSSKGLPLLIVSDLGMDWVGKKMTISQKEIVQKIYSKSQITTSTLAKELNISTQNASIKLKKLMDDGYLLGEKINSISGGHEYIYTPFYTKKEVEDNKQKPHSKWG